MNAPLAYPPARAEPPLSTSGSTARDGLLRRLAAAVRERRASAARPLLAALQHLAPSDPAVLEWQARLLALEDRAAEALDLLGHAALSPSLLLCRGELRLQVQNPAGAAADFADAVLAGPASVEARALLGMALSQLGCTADALACLRDAVAGAPGHAAYWQALAQALHTAGDAEAAAATLSNAIARCPADLGLRRSAIMLAMQRRDHAGAAALAELARRAGVADACVLGLLGHALSSLGRHADAALAYADARMLAPEDPYVRHLAAAAGLSPDAGQAAPEYVEVVFDGYAPRFDAHIGSLGYRIPGVLRAELAAWDGAGPVLDLGCGTGLAAAALAGLPLGPFIGVDLSSGMLARAAGGRRYAELHHAEIGAFLTRETRSFPLILAADVLPYFGDLAPLLRLAAPRLAPCGTMLASVEDLGGEGTWRLGRLGRYQHTATHVRDAAGQAGLHVAVLRPEAVRQEGNAPVPGLFVVLRKEAS